MVYKLLVYILMVYKITILKYKGFKNWSYVFVICCIIDDDQFLMILLPFYWSKIWFCQIISDDSFSEYIKNFNCFNKTYRYIWYTDTYFIKG